MRPTKFSPLIVCFALATAAPQAHAEDPASACGAAIRALAEARERIGADSRAGALLIESSGEFDQSAERQGMTTEGRSPAPYLERFAVDWADGRVAYEYRIDRIDGSWEHAREAALPPDEWSISGVGEAWGVRFEHPRFADKRRRLLRRLPHALLDEMLERRASLRLADPAGGTVTGTLRDGMLIEVSLHPESGLPISAAYVMDFPTLGDTTIRWRYGDWRPVTGFGLLPFEYGVSVAGRPLTTMRVDAARAGDPESIEVLRATADDALPPARPAPKNFFDPDASARVEQVGDGAWLVRDLRNGFHTMFFDVGDGVVAIDAPAGYPLLGELPAGDAAPGATSSSLTERFIELIRETIPDKPITHVVLTHFHNDHAGGLRAFAREGAAIVVARPNAAAVKAMLRAPHTVAPDGLSDPASVEILPVDSERTIGAGARTLRVIDIGTNPHARGLLAVSVPALDAVYVADLIYPGPLDRFPDPAHEAAARFLVRWLDGRALSPTTVFASHGAPRATAAHLQRLRSLDAEGAR